MVIRVCEWFLGIRVRREGKPKTQVQTTNLGHPPCRFDSQVCENYLVRSRAAGNSKSVFRATLYDGVGSVKRHLDCARREGSFFFLLP
jgi:hypothetical protein